MSLLPFSICLCFFIFLIGCDDVVIPDPPEPPPPLPSISDRLVARIYFDATLSMQGFVVPGSTRYTQICPYLESVIVSSWENEDVNFFRFGEQVEPIDRDTYLQAGYVDFYEDENIYRETFIQKVIDYEDQLASNKTEGITISKVSGPNTPEESTETVPPTEEVDAEKKEGGLVVIVTDLFQDRGDINLLVAQLKEKYIKKEIEIGLFGLGSQFNGTVYDIGIGQEPLPYRSNPTNPETFRPFYLLVLGRYADIAHYFNRLKANNPDAKTIIFSRYLVNPLLSFEGAAVESNNLNNKTFVNSEDPRLKQFQIVNSSDPVDISAKLEYVPLQHAMFFDTDTFEVSIVVECADEEETQKREAQECLNVKSTLLKNEKNNKLSVAFDLSSSLQSAVYLYEVTLSPGIDTYRSPEWCSNWDMGAARDGSKTLNLVNFVQNLSQVTARRHRPKIAQFHCYIEKR